MHQTTLQEAAPVFKIFVAINAIIAIIVTNMIRVRPREKTNMIIIFRDYRYHP